MMVKLDLIRGRVLASFDNLSDKFFPVSRIFEPQTEVHVGESQAELVAELNEVFNQNAPLELPDPYVCCPQQKVNFG